MPSKSPPTPPEWQLHLWENFVLMLLKLRQVFLNPKFLDISNTCCTFFQPHRLGWWFLSFPDMVCQKDITLLSMPGYFKTAYICFFENSEVEHRKYITPKLMKTNQPLTIFQKYSLTLPNHWIQAFQSLAWCIKSSARHADCFYKQHLWKNRLLSFSSYCYYNNVEVSGNDSNWAIKSWATLNHKADADVHNVQSSPTFLIVSHYRPPNFSELETSLTSPSAIQSIGCSGVKYAITGL